jgi:Fe-S oxidoreductase
VNIVSGGATEPGQTKRGTSMSLEETRSVDTEKIKAMLNRKKARMKLCLAACASCTLCAESCFLFMSNDKDPHYMPSYKVTNSLGKLYKKRGRVSRAILEEIKELIWKNCVLCGRCYCPFGIDIPDMISFARSILRSQGITGVYPHSLGAPENDYLHSLNQIDVSEKEEGKPGGEG